MDATATTGEPGEIDTRQKANVDSVARNANRGHDPLIDQQQQQQQTNSGYKQQHECQTNKGLATDKRDDSRHFDESVSKIETTQTNGNNSEV